MKLYTIGPNQTTVEFKDGKVVLFSYDTPVVAYIPDKGYIRTATHYSATTTRHINSYLRDRAFEFVNGDIFDRLLDL